MQGRIHTGFHRFTEIGQIFIRNIFLIIIELSKLKSGKWSGQMFSFSNFWEFDAPSMNQKPGKGNFRELVSKKIPGGACPWAPLEACSLGPSFRKSVSIYPRSTPELHSFLSILPPCLAQNLSSLGTKINRCKIAFTAINNDIHLI